MKDWSRNDKLAFAGVLVGVLGIAIALLQPALDSGSHVNINTAKQIVAPTVEPPAVESPAVKKTGEISVMVNIPGSNNNLTVLPLKTGAAKAQNINMIGGNSNQTIYLASGQTAEINVPGNRNTIKVARSVSAQITFNSQGEGNVQTQIPDPK